MESIQEAIEVSPAKKQWSAIGVGPHHGICVPLFSLHSQRSGGVGEYTDLIPLLDWCHKVKMDVLQVLPLNDTGPESSPYSALSAYALNPLHIGIAALPNFAENHSLMLCYRELQRLNQTQRINYRRLLPLREKLLRDYFCLYGEDILSSEDYQQFVAKNPWLKGYSVFKALKEDHHWQPWDQWPEDIRKPDESTLQKLWEMYEVEASYHQCLQFFCFQQMAEVKIHAEKLGIFIKGDIPILINRESADVWQYRSFFDLNLSAGAPPDYYSSEGQNWGFPLYNWKTIEQDNYRWWRNRLALASNFYHLYRIDHVVGFYRIWGVPAGKKAIEGSFVPSDRASWVDHGEKIMSMMLESTDMLPIGEDLGTVPNEVRYSLTQLGICGTKVMRWERFWKQKDQPFLIPNEYPPLSMTSLSTHDSSTLALWWEEQPKEAKQYADQRGWEYRARLPEDEHFAILYDSHHTNSIFHINLLNEYLAFFPELVWPKLEDERINIPGIISDFNWTYRFRPSVEEICNHQSLAYLIEDVTTPSTS